MLSANALADRNIERTAIPTRISRSEWLVTNGLGATPPVPSRAP